MGEKWGVKAYGVSRWGQSLLTEVYHHAKMDLVIARGLKRIWESKMGTHYSERIIEDVDVALKEMEIVYRENWAAIVGLDDTNGHRNKLLSEGKSISWGGVQTKGKGRECELTKIDILAH